MKPKLGALCNQNPSGHPRIECASAQSAVSICPSEQIATLVPDLNDNGCHCKKYPGKSSNQPEWQKKKNKLGRSRCCEARANTEILIANVLQQASWCNIRPQVSEFDKCLHLLFRRKICSPSGPDWLGWCLQALWFPPCWKAGWLRTRWVSDRTYFPTFVA